MSRPGYVDIRYLEQLAKAVQPLKKRTLELMNIREGSSAADFGCGPATDTISIARLVGPGGTVVGIDADDAMIAAAKANSSTAGVETITEYRCCDAVSTGLGSGVLDAARSERLFQHVPEPSRVLDEMMRVTRSGGRIVVADTDHSSLTIDTDLDDTLWKLRRFYTGWVTNGCSGRKLYRMFRRAGLDAVSAEPVTVCTHSFEALSMAGELSAVARDAIAAGALERDEWDALSEECVAHSREGSFYGSLTMIIVAGTRS